MDRKCESSNKTCVQVDVCETRETYHQPKDTTLELPERYLFFSVSWRLINFISIPHWRGHFGVVEFEHNINERRARVLLGKLERNKLTCVIFVCLH